MCGIAGAVNWGDANTLARMTDVQAHRGPDDRGIWHAEFPGGWVGLGSHRLAILNLSPAGHMPMASPLSPGRVDVEQHLAAHRTRDDQGLPLVVRRRTALACVVKD